MNSFRLRFGYSSYWFSHDIIYTYDDTTDTDNPIHVDFGDINPEDDLMIIRTGSDSHEMKIVEIVLRLYPILGKY